MEMFVFYRQAENEEDGTQPLLKELFLYVGMIGNVKPHCITTLLVGQLESYIF
jgi:hypothetical protein